MAINITESELVAAIEQAQFPAEGDDSAFTTGEVAKLLGVGQQTAGRKLSTLVEAGLAERCKARKPDAWGELKMVKAYRLVKAN